MNIIALDLASKTGWANFSDGRIIASGVQDFTKRRGESNGILFLRFRKWLIWLTETERPDVIAYEAAHFRGGAATEVCVGLQTHAQSIAAEIGCLSMPIQTMSLKKWATGSGSAKKPDMIEAAVRLSGIIPEDDNHADAVLLALYAAHEVAPEVPRA
jgi:Holliday junction resolvasome RuvABC endonuclease subunit